MPFLLTTCVSKSLFSRVSLVLSFFTSCSYFMYICISSDITSVKVVVLVWTLILYVAYNMVPVFVC